MALNGKITLEELVRNYKGCCELWKIKLAASSIVELGIPPQDWEDLMQEMMLWVASFRYNPQVHAASESTVLGTRIRSRIQNRKRAFGRRVQFDRRYHNLSHPLTYTVDMLYLIGESPRHTLCRAVLAAVAQLKNSLRRICWMLMNGMTLRAIARKLEVRFSEVFCRMQQIRRQFVDMGLEEIIEWRRKMFRA